MPRINKYSPEMVDRAEDYLRTFEDNKKLKKLERNCFVGKKLIRIHVPAFPTLCELAGILGISDATRIGWCDRYPDFKDVCDRIMARFEQIVIENAVIDKYNAQFSRFLLMAYHGRKERTDVTSNDRTVAPILGGLTHDEDAK